MAISAANAINALILTGLNMIAFTWERSIARTALESAPVMTMMSGFGSGRERDVLPRLPLAR